MNTPAIADKLMARLIARIMYKPFGPVRPSKNTCIRNLEKEVPVDEAEYNTWNKEEFLLANDGIEIPAEYHPVKNAKGVAILAHGFGQNRYVMIPQARMFREMGYSTVIFDQRHFGESKAPNGTFSVREATDLVALVEWAKRKCGEDTRIVVLGVSMGAMTVMHAMAATDKIDAAVEDCGPAEMERILDPFYKSVSNKPNRFLKDVIRKASAGYGAPSQDNRPVKDVAKSDIPLLVIHGEADSLVSLDHAHDIIAAAKNPKSRIKTFPGREHAYSIQDREVYRETVAVFLKDVFEE